MGRFLSYINCAISLVQGYKGDVPFATFSKKFFAANKKYGSNDRRQINALCYSFFRMGFPSPKMTPEERMMTGFFLCSTEPSPLLERMNPQWNEMASANLDNKLEICGTFFSGQNIFPFPGELSDGVEPVSWQKSLFSQPRLFIRTRPQHMIAVLKKLEKSKTSFEQVGDHCISLPVSFDAANLFTIDKEVVIQDYSSQQVLNYLAGYLHDRQPVSKPKPFSVWDCCAASGGKSILLHDIPGVKFELTISDIRPSIILNLHQRFARAGIKEYNYFIADISSEGFNPPATGFDCVICDAPCTGSGTWGRTPEQLYLFNRASIGMFSQRQKKIVQNVFPHLREDGLFIYITCSIFRKENEEVVEFLRDKFNAKVLHQELIRGYDKQADSMFVAVMQK